MMLSTRVVEHIVQMGTPARRLPGEPIAEAQSRAPTPPLTSTAQRNTLQRGPSDAFYRVPARN